MPRTFLLSNGRLAVNFDGHHRIRDIFFPRVGEDNHGGLPQRFGIWCEGQMAWLGDEGWSYHASSAPQSLTALVTAHHERMGITLRFENAIDPRIDLLSRSITVENLRNTAREVRIFGGALLHLRESDWANTAYYDPDAQAVVHYKRDAWFALGCTPLSGFTTGKCAPDGHWGSWREAESGALGQVPITQGTVDSCLQATLTLAPGGAQACLFWMAAAKGRNELLALLHAAGELGIAQTSERANAAARTRLAAATLTGMPPERRAMVEQSLLLIAAHTEAGGAIIAGADSDILWFGRDTYAYVWPRDGALAADTLGRAGCRAEAEAYFRFSARAVCPEGWFFHKYTPSGLPGSSWHPWIHEGKKQLPVQEDETALTLWALWRHWRRTGDDAFVRSVYDALVHRPAKWMLGFRDENGLPLPSYDLWEERRGVHAFTVGAVIGAFEAAAELARLAGYSADAARYAAAAGEMRAAAARILYRPEWGRFARRVSRAHDAGAYEADPVVDAALYGLAAFGAFEAADARMTGTLEAVEAALRVRAPAGGYARYENDYYHQVIKNSPGVPGNPWIISTLWVAQWRLARGEQAAAEELIEWAAARALSSGVLPEQVHPLTGEPISVCPLMWSHAAFVAAALDAVEAKSLHRPEQLGTL